jgi:hypothetical protein
MRWIVGGNATSGCAASATLPVIPEARTIRVPHQDEPRIGQGRRGGWVIRSRAAPDDDANASFRTKSQSLPHRPAIVVNGRISSFAWLIGGTAPLPNAPVRVAQIMSARPFLTGPTLTLADLHAAAMLAYFTVTTEADQLLALHSGLREWWDRMVIRRSMISTAYP